MGNWARLSSPLVIVFGASDHDLIISVQLTVDAFQAVSHRGCRTSSDQRDALLLPIAALCRRRCSVSSTGVSVPIVARHYTAAVADGVNVRIHFSAEVDTTGTP